jgi:glycosyltransferase involved in cell wall biosynthesis
LGNVVLEAMSCGLKTLCSIRAGASAFLPDELRIQNPADPEELAAKIRALRGGKEAVPFVSKGAGVEDFVLLAERVAEEKRKGSGNR